MTIFEGTTPETIDLAKARELLAKAVKTKGADFVYKAQGAKGMCHYYPQNARSLADDDPRRTTGCLVGVALKLHGHDVSQLAGSVGEVWRQHRGWMTEAACQYFQEAQNSQDNGKTWGDAHARAELRATDGTLDEVFI